MSLTTERALPLKPEERRQQLADVAADEWRWAPPDLSSCFWAPRIAVHRVSDPDHPRDSFRVVLDEDFHHDNVFRAACFNDNGEVTRTVVTATPRVDGAHVSRREDDIVLLADRILEKFKDAPVVNLRK
ncbi:MAG: hypothetical protein J0M12_11265 [Deltaproteobacteria bacterium]|nr:hypothetical protein [Deltaproteobacteria bacterium]